MQNVYATVLYPLLAAAAVVESVGIGAVGACGVAAANGLHKCVDALPYQTTRDKIVKFMARSAVNLTGFAGSLMVGTGAGIASTVIGGLACGALFGLSAVSVGPVVGVAAFALSSAYCMNKSMRFDLEQRAVKA